MNTFERQDDGSIILPLLTIEDSPKVFGSQEEYEEWLADRKQAILEQTRKNLSPHEFYITQGKSMERPYANDYWWVKDVGTYSWKVCGQKLFLSEHRFKAENGYTNFWNHIVEAVDYKDDSLDNHLSASNQAYIQPQFRDRFPELRAVWSNWESHLGFVYDDGPGPFYKRFTINSSSVDFKEKPWFDEPLFNNKERMLLHDYDAHVDFVKSQRELVEKHEKALGIEPEKDHIDIKSDPNEDFLDDRIMKILRKRLHFQKPHVKKR